MAFLIQFNAKTVEPNVAPEPVPTGTYPVVIVESGEKAVSGDNSKAYWEIVMEVISGEQKGRKIYERLNHKNSNPKTVEIAMSTLSSICYVTGVIVIQQSSQELHGKPFQVKVVKVPRDDDPTRFTNNVRGYLDALGYEPGKRPDDAANATAGSSWGGAPTTQQPQAEQPAQQAQPQNWGATAEPAKTIEHQPAAAATAQPAQTQAADPRLVALLTAGVDLATAQAAIAAQDAQAAAAPATTQAQPATGANAPVTGAPTAEQIAAQAAAMVGGGAGATGGDGGVPDWAK